MAYGTVVQPPLFPEEVGLVALNTSESRSRYILDNYLDAHDDIEAIDGNNTQTTLLPFTMETTVTEVEGPAAMSLLREATKMLACWLDDARTPKENMVLLSAILEIAKPWHTVCGYPAGEAEKSLFDVVAYIAEELPDTSKREANFLIVKTAAAVGNAELTEVMLESSGSWEPVVEQCLVGGDCIEDSIVHTLLETLVLERQYGKARRFVETQATADLYAVRLAYLLEKHRPEAVELVRQKLALAGSDKASWGAGEEQIACLLIQAQAERASWVDHYPADQKMTPHIKLGQIQLACGHKELARQSARDAWLLITEQLQAATVENRAVHSEFWFYDVGMLAARTGEEAITNEVLAAILQAPFPRSESSEEDREDLYNTVLAERERCVRSEGQSFQPMAANGACDVASIEEAVSLISAPIHNIYDARQAVVLLSAAALRLHELSVGSNVDPVFTTAGAIAIRVVGIPRDVFWGLANEDMDD